MKFIKRKSNNSSKSTVDIGLAEDKIFKYFISYALLVAYLLASISSTTDLMLLQSVDGMKLPFIDSNISIRGFFIAAPVIVAAASTYMAREFLILNISKRKQSQTTSFIFSLSKTTPGKKIFGVDGDFDKIVLHMISCGMFFVLGPLVLLIITIRFADYQDKIIFPVHVSLFAVTAYLSWIFYRRVEGITPKSRVSQISRLTGGLLIVVVAFKLLICIDVILIPSNYSPTMYVKQNTNWLDNVDYGTSSIIPHLVIDRAIPIIYPKTKDYSNMPLKNDGKTVKDSFLNRAIGIDLRGRNLKYLDIPFQFVPRIWAHDADFSGANLSFTRIPGSNFVNTNFYGANLYMSQADGSRFFSANMEKIKIETSYMRGISVDGTTFSDVLLISVDFSGSSFSGVNINNSKLTGVDFSGVHFFETKLNNNIMHINEASPIFPSLLSANNEFGEYSDAFNENEIAAVTAMAKKFCAKSLSISDELALKNIASMSLLADGHEAGRIQKLRDKLKELSCDSAVEFLTVE